MSVTFTGVTVPVKLRSSTLFIVFDLSVAGYNFIGPISILTTEFTGNFEFFRSFSIDSHPSTLPFVRSEALFSVACAPPSSVL